MWGVDALLADDVVARLSAAAAGAASDTNSSALVQWIQTMLDHVAPVAISWSAAFAAAAESKTNVVSSLSDLIADIACLLPSEQLDLHDSDHTGIFHALARAQQLLQPPPERSLVAAFDSATTRCFQELSRNLQSVVQRCVHTDDFSATAAPSVKHSSSAVDVSCPSTRPFHFMRTSIILFNRLPVVRRCAQPCQTSPRPGSDSACLPLRLLPASADGPWRSC